ncbi:CubicO group peptidase (beta-lactamase class C family) [Salimicrobium jeotgali]|nr:CubicO group peptidase (beta-lactamase class C family) [Salimicrobium jeotgali]
MIGENGKIFDETIGHRALYPRKLPMTQDTIFDLASLTKVIVTTPLILQLVDDREITFKDKVSYFIPEFSEGDKSRISVEHLLTHTSGLPAHRAYFKYLNSKKEVVQAVIKEPLVYSPGEKMVYSDIGFILLGHLIEQITGTSLQQLAKKKLFIPLGMAETSFSPEVSKDCVAATEAGKSGIVHDENAEAMGGAAGHAGLFSSMEDVVAWTTMWNNDGVFNRQEIISSTLIQKIVKEKREGRGMGWEVDNLGYGHTGFTGTSIRFEKNWTAVLLTNRIHAGRDTPILEMRKKLYEEIRASLM